MLSVGASKESIGEARAAILDILKAGRCDDVTESALSCLKAACTVTDVTISQCSFVDEKKAAPNSPPAEGPAFITTKEVS